MKSSTQAEHNKYVEWGKKDARRGIKLIKRDIHPEGCTKTMDRWME
jgi:hypothetical protein